MEILGVCRFSFFGKSDTKLDYSNEKAAFEALYDAQRMQQRFFLFENLLLPSIKAQSDQDFKLLILTSQVMPAEYRHRLQKLCETVPMIELVVADTMNISNVLRPYVRQMSNDKSDDLLQFRIDDDDCISCNYIEQLRRYAAASAPDKVVSFPKGLILYKSKGKGVVAPSYRAFSGAGFAFHSSPGRIKHIFKFSHSNTRFIWPAVLVPTFVSYIQCFHGSADTIYRQKERINQVSLALNRKKRMHYSLNVLPKTLENSFPFLNRQALYEIANEMN